MVNMKRYHGKDPHRLLERRYPGYTTTLVMQTLLRVSTRLLPTQERRVALGAPRREIPRRFARVSTGCGGPSTRSTLRRKPKQGSEQTNQRERPKSLSSASQFRTCILVVSTPPGHLVIAAEQSAMPPYSRERSRHCDIHRHGLTLHG